MNEAWTALKKSLQAAGYKSVKLQPAARSGSMRLELQPADLRGADENFAALPILVKHGIEHDGVNIFSDVGGNSLMVRNVRAPEPKEEPKKQPKDK